MEDGMGKSRKPSANIKKVAAFKSQLSWEGSGEFDDIFAREEARSERRSAEHDEALYEKACASKNRYATHADAQEAARLCAEHGTSGLRSYKCRYCGGWHLTSKPKE